jgi:PKD repeat protein
MTIMKYLICIALIAFSVSACKKEKEVKSTKAKFGVTGFDQPVPCTITFINNSVNTTTSEWSLGDGTVSTERNPTHVYTAIGDYYIKLKVTGPTGKDSITSILSLNRVTPGESSFAYFRDRSGGLPVNISFVSLNPLSQYYSWNFGLGVTSLERNPIVNIQNAGVYPIKFSSQINGVRDTTELTLVVN